MTTVWKDSQRKKDQTKCRDYSLGSFFSSILTAISDPKDGKGLLVKTNPPYAKDARRKSRKETQTVLRSGFNS